jgi:hypothetical protein
MWKIVERCNFPFTTGSVYKKKAPEKGAFRLDLFARLALAALPLILVFAVVVVAFVVGPLLATFFILVVLVLLTWLATLLMTSALLVLFLLVFLVVAHEISPLLGDGKHTVRKSCS